MPDCSAVGCGIWDYFIGPVRGQPHGITADEDDERPKAVVQLGLILGDSEENGFYGTDFERFLPGKRRRWLPVRCF